MKRLPSPDAIILSWISILPKHHVPNKSKQRIEAIENLFKGFRALGYSSEDFTEDTFSKIVDRCVNNKMEDKEILAKWKSDVSSQMYIAFYKVFPLFKVGE